MGMMGKCYLVSLKCFLIPCKHGEMINRFHHINKNRNSLQSVLSLLNLNEIEINAQVTRADRSLKSNWLWWGNGWAYWELLLPPVTIIVVHRVKADKQNAALNSNLQNYSIRKANEFKTPLYQCEQSTACITEWCLLLMRKANSFTCLLVSIRGGNI